MVPGVIAAYDGAQWVQKEDPMSQYRPYQAGQANPYAAPRTPSMTPAKERSWAVVVHVVTGVATLLSAGFLGFVAALVIFLVYKDRGPFVRQAAANAVNIQVTGLLWGALIVVVGLLTLGLGWFLLGVVPVVMVVLHALGAVQASRGEWGRPPLTVPVLR